jgi:hypothetical protein
MHRVRGPVKRSRSLWHACALALTSSLSCTNEGGGGGSEGGGSGSAGAASEPRPCSQGTFAVATRADGAGFPYPDGTAVTATLGLTVPDTGSTTIVGGAFSVSLYEDNPTCNLGGLTTTPAALYIDVNADGACTLADDVVILWSATGGAGGTSEEGMNHVELSPATGSCVRSLPLTYYHGEVDRVRDVVRRLCPEIQDCLPFCRPTDPPSQNLPDRYGGFCGRDPGIGDAGTP